MKAMVLKTFGPIDQSPLRLQDVANPTPGPDELLVRVDVCGVCRTDLHIVEGELPETKLPIIPGHQVVGGVVECGEKAGRFSVGDRVGMAWLNHTCGRCGFCTTGRENLCRDARFTGFDVNGGFAEFAVVPAEFAYHVPDEIPIENVAPLLCAGIIGYRSLKFACENDRQRIGMVGFGASAHIAIQVARHWGKDVYVFSRTEHHREHARQLGAVWVGGLEDDLDVKLDSAVFFAPSGKLIPPILEKLDRGGSLVLAGIYLSPTPPLDYEKHLYHERQIRSVMAATRQDGQELIDLGQSIPIRTDIEMFPLDKANEALKKLKASDLRGSAVLKIG